MSEERTKNCNQLLSHEGNSDFVIPFPYGISIVSLWKTIRFLMEND